MTRDGPAPTMQPAATLWMIGRGWCPDCSTPERKVELRPAGDGGRACPECGEAYLDGGGG